MRSAGETAPDGLDEPIRGPHDTRMYRAPGREADPEVIPAPPARALLSPLLWGLGALSVLVVPVSVLNVLLVPDAGHTSREIRFVPAVETFEDVLMLVVLGTFVVTIAQLVRRVAPQWSGLSTPAKLAYVAGLVFAQGLFVVGGETALLASRGGLELFGPSLKASYAGPGGRSAHVMGGGLGCGLELFVADPLSPTMHRVQRLTGHCGEGARARWRGAADPILVDEADTPLLDGPSPRFFGWGGGC